MTEDKNITTRIMLDLISRYEARVGSEEGELLEREICDTARSLGYIEGIIIYGSNGAYVPIVENDKGEKRYKLDQVLTKTGLDQLERSFTRKQTTYFIHENLFFGREGRIKDDFKGDSSRFEKAFELLTPIGKNKSGFN